MSDENTVSLKLWTFWTFQPEVWFAQAEAQFMLWGISASDTKYFSIPTALNQETATHLLDLIPQPPGDYKYEELKDRLLAIFGISRRECTSCLVCFCPLGDFKPSALMDEMLVLLGNHPVSAI